MIKLPLDRVGAVIGKKGRTKRKIEKVADVRILVDSESGEVEIVGDDKTLPENFYKACLVVQAIGLGFDDRSAMELFGDDRYVEVIDLVDLVGRSPSAIHRQKARLIGRGGSAREKIETLTGTKIRVYEKSVAIIGDEEGVITAKRAIERLVGDGSPHNVVFRDLEESQRRRKQRRVLRDLGFNL